MGILSKIIDSFTGANKEPGAKIEIFKNDNANARIFQPPGTDARPLDKDVCFSENSEDTEGGKDILGFITFDPKSEKGEYRIFSRNEAGEIQAELYLKKSGLTDLKNQVQVLSLLMAELFTELRSITTVGSATNQAVDVPTQTRLTTLENKFKQLIG